MRPSKIQPSPGEKEWLLTYSGLVTLLLVFFVCLWGISSVDMVKFQQVVSSFQSQGIASGSDEHGGSWKEDGGGNLQGGQMYSGAVGYIKKQELSDLVGVSYEEGGISFDIKEDVLFDPESAVLKPGARDLLDRLAEFFSGFTNQIVVEGHTDDRPISTLRYPSNWELSSDRAAKVVRYLTEERGLAPGRFCVVGYGGQRPVVPNTSPENRAKNRRVMLVIKTREMPREVSVN